MLKPVLSCACMFCAVLGLSAMPTKDELMAAESAVRRMMVTEQAAFKAGTKTQSEVAEVALRRERESSTEAAKLLLIKGAFILYVKDGNIDKAAATMRYLKRTIADLPPYCITNIVETSSLGLENKADVRSRIYGSLDSLESGRTTVQSIIDGMIKVPGRNYWLSATELTQGQWETVMGYNLSKHKGDNFPVENISRDDCAIFLEKLNNMREVLLTRFEFDLPTLTEWSYAAQAGGEGLDCWIKPGFVGNVLDMAWVAENSSNATHAVATKAPNAFGFYDMLGNVWEWMKCEQENVGCRHGGSFRESATDCTIKKGYHNPRNRRFDNFGVRLVARIRSKIEICPDERKR